MSREKVWFLPWYILLSLQSSWHRLQCRYLVTWVQEETCLKIKEMTDTPKGQTADREAERAGLSGGRQDGAGTPEVVSPAPVLGCTWHHGIRYGQARPAQWPPFCTRDIKPGGSGCGWMFKAVISEVFYLNAPACFGCDLHSCQTLTDLGGSAPSKKRDEVGYHGWHHLNTFKNQVILAKQSGKMKKQTEKGSKAGKACSPFPSWAPLL